MSQTSLSLGALACVSVLALNAQHATAQHARTGIARDAEALMTALAADVLDQGATLPFEASGAPDSLATGLPAALDAWDGLDRRVSVEGPLGPLALRLQAAVQRVAKDGTRYVPTPDPSPHRLAAVTLLGPFGLRVTLSRLYAQPV